MYKLIDTYEAPQCTPDVITFETWCELQEYLDENPDVMDRIENGYAFITEFQEPYHETRNRI